MFLHDVLRVLANQIEPLGFTRVNLYEILFQEILDECMFGIEDTVKQLFSGSRPLKADIMRQLCRIEGFDVLCENIRTKYLPVAGDHSGIYDALSGLLYECPYMREADVERIIASCDASQDAELSRFIAACIVCGSYNTAQRKKKAPKLGAQYGLNLDYMRLGTPVAAIQIKNELWKASQTQFLASRREGSRFYGLDVIQRLLPQGYVSTKHFLSRGQTEDGREAPLAELCAQSVDDIAVIGDGGIGKTTFLQHLLEAEFLLPDGKVRPCPQNHPVPFFIELNRCPDHIGDWYEDGLKKTNFITRYIGQIKENHSTLDSVLPETLTVIEKELQRIPEDGKPQYLLLLDGFNEVRADYFVRSYLSSEISMLHRYPNVRIITTSRETQAAYYAADFKNIRLVGLKIEDIVAHLVSSHIPEPVIGNAMSRPSLVKCLRIPLYLCLFSAVSGSGDFLPETAGEILYCFFHKNSTFYNARTRFAQTQPNRADHQRLAFILDFVLPYIGWAFEDADSFSMNEQKFHDTISEAMLHIQTLFVRHQTNPFRAFHYSGLVMRQVWGSFYDQDGNLDVQFIIAAVYDYLGIIYRYEVVEGPFADRIRYSFCHHHFRDYFSAMWDARLLSMLQCVPTEAFGRQAPKASETGTFRYFLDGHHWSPQKTNFISEVLMEHRNRPKLDTKTQNWYLPEPQYDEQRVLTHAIEYCRVLNRTGQEIHHILRNILASVLYGRKEYSGMDLSELNLQECNFFNVACSKRGKTRALTTKFDRSSLSSSNFQSENHQSDVIAFVYFDRMCFTIDVEGVIKCWDIMSGRLEYQMRSGNPRGTMDSSRGSFLMVSNNGRWLGAKVQVSDRDGACVFVNLFDLEHPDMPPRKIRPTFKHDILNYFTFTEDSKSLLMLCDQNTVYCLDVETGKLYYSRVFELYQVSKLYADSADSDIFACTAEYITHKVGNLFIHLEEDDYWYDNDSNGNTKKIRQGIPCELCILTPNTNKKCILYSFVGKPGTEPVASYFPHQQCFVLYNYNGRHLEQFDCNSGKSTVILENLAQAHDTQPIAIVPLRGYSDKAYIIYMDICYSVDIRPGIDGRVLMTCPITAAEKFLPDSKYNNALQFNSIAILNANRFVVGNYENSYEWDTANDVLLRKYNSVNYQCAAFFTNSQKDTGILVHQSNGISIFGDVPARLQNQICFQDPEYLIKLACYDKIGDRLALVLTCHGHGKVVLLDLATSMEHTIYSVGQQEDYIEQICFSNNGDDLLILSRFQCQEYEVQSGQLFEVARTGCDEIFVAGHYSGDEIEIAVVGQSKKSHVKPHCTFYQRYAKNGKRFYLHTWGYFMPQLKKEQFCYFIHQSVDLNVEIYVYDEEGYQYGVTRGFFLENLPALKQIFHPKCYAWFGNRRHQFEKEFQPFEQIFVWHKDSFNEYIRDGGDEVSYMYLSADSSEAIITSNRECLVYYRNLHDLTYQRLQEVLHDRLVNMPLEGAYWSYAIPWQDNTLIGCYAFYRLIGMEENGNKILEPIHYYPGIAISGCSFSNIAADAETREIIRTNGVVL